MHAETLTLWAGRLWETDDPYPLLASVWEADPLPGEGLWLPAAVLRIPRDPQAFAPWNEAVRQGYATLDNALDGAGSPASATACSTRARPGCGIAIPSTR